MIDSKTKSNRLTLCHLDLASACAHSDQVCIQTKQGLNLYIFIYSWYYSSSRMTPETSQPSC